jgi:excisionase family DNA binding protein
VSEAMMTLREVARYLHFSQMSVRRYIKKGLPAYRVGNSWRFLRSEIDEWLKTFRVKP